MFIDNMVNIVEQSHLKGIAIGEAQGEARGEARGDARGEARGEARGKAEGMRTLLLQLATSKWGTLPSQVVADVAAVEDVDLLGALSENFLQMSSSEDFAHAVRTILSQCPKRRM